MPTSWDFHSSHATGPQQLIQITAQQNRMKQNETDRNNTERNRTEQNRTDWKGTENLIHLIHLCLQDAIY